MSWWRKTKVNALLLLLRWWREKQCQVIRWWIKQIGIGVFPTLPMIGGTNKQDLCTNWQSQPLAISLSIGSISSWRSRIESTGERIAVISLVIPRKLSDHSKRFHWIRATSLVTGRRSSGSGGMECIGVEIRSRLDVVLLIQWRGDWFVWCYRFFSGCGATRGREDAAFVHSWPKWIGFWVESPSNKCIVSMAKSILITSALVLIGLWPPTKKLDACHLYL